ncbi:hypothetical protein OVA26_16865 [Microbacterium sp. SL62]|uniref:hypothetical protein n=1 Tax=Microbacterium sp. SL62 TaxID=2995139 RepID=UPI0022755BE5|nr:hypothetical protein [Microbacterium sp. SL62]MCY1718611.1 hypothetical protein [Microbacterium sp. SL62]
MHARGPLTDKSDRVAAKAATKIARGLNFTVTDLESFRVEGYEGALVDGDSRFGTAVVIPVF